MRKRMPYPRANDVQLRKARLVGRPAAKIGADGGAYLGLMLFGEAKQALETIFPHIETGKGLLLKCARCSLNRAESILSGLQHRTLPFCVEVRLYRTMDTSAHLLFRRVAVRA
jgi:hypothetical protein